MFARHVRVAHRRSQIAVAHRLFDECWTFAFAEPHPHATMAKIVLTKRRQQLRAFRCELISVEQ
jgi:hypothetical protein